MRKFIKTAGILLLLGTLFRPSGILAEDTKISSEQLERLLNRLEQAEKRIQELEETKPVTPPPTPQAEPQRETIPLLPPRLERAAGGLDDSEEMLINNYTDDSGSPAFETRLSTLEEDWKKFSESEQEKKAKDANKATTMKITGRIHLDGWNFSDSTPGIAAFNNPADPMDPENNLEFRRLRLGFAGDIKDNMLYKLEFDFDDANDPTIKDAYIGWNDLPVFQTLLIGNQKRPLGMDHLNSSRFNWFLERPLVIEAFNQDARRLGIAAYGVSEEETWNWRYGIYELENIANDSGYAGDAGQYSLNARLAGTPWYDETSGGRGYLHLGIADMWAKPDGDPSATASNNNEARFRTRPEARSGSVRWLDTGAIAGADWFNTLGLEAMLTVGSFSVVSEYQVTYVGRGATGPDLTFEGAYVEAGYFLTGEYQPINRRTGTIERVKPLENFFWVNTCDGETGGGWGAWQVIARYSYLDLSDGDITGGDERNFTAGMVWWWNSHARMQFNYIHAQIDDRGPIDGYTDGRSDIFGVRFSVDF
ncbi:OprO/OprP family phosphate-selective porin [Gimesia sp.]|uniref:OprO/OprP family phosphate-selective porin n=1 Tax=Gimesia sp. TaxID=2024833 RepID=UPI003A8DBD8F